jgi:hypothetical protein
MGTAAGLAGIDHRQADAVIADALHQPIGGSQPCRSFTDMFI